MKIFFIENRTWIIFCAAITLVFGIYFWHQKTIEIHALDVQIEQSDADIERYRRVIAHIAVLKKEYTVLATKYLAHKDTLGTLEASFTEAVYRVCKRDGVTFVGMSYGDYNGNQPPPVNIIPVGNPGTYVAPIPQVIPAVGSAPTTNFGATHNGDPKNQKMNDTIIPSDIFNKIPTTITISGHWKPITIALQDLSREDILMSIEYPDIRAIGDGNLSATFAAQVLTPAIDIIPELLDKNVLEPLMFPRITNVQKDKVNSNKVSK